METVDKMTRREIDQIVSVKTKKQNPDYVETSVSVEDEEKIKKALEKRFGK